MQNNNLRPVKNNKGKGCLKIFIVFFLIFISIIYISDFFSTTDHGDYKSNGCSDTDKIYAYNCAINFVKKELKSPSSAIFPNSKQKVYDTQCSSDNTYKIVSSVESTNSFGAMITTNFSCTISFNEDKVRCEDLIFY